MPISRPTATDRAAAAATVDSLPVELAQLHAAALAYDPAVPDQRAAARLVAEAQDVALAARAQRAVEGAAAIAAAWAALKLDATADAPTLDAVQAILAQAQRLHRLLTEGAR